MLRHIVTDLLEHYVNEVLKPKLGPAGQSTAEGPGKGGPEAGGVNQVLIRESDRQYTTSDIEHVVRRFLTECVYSVYGTHLHECHGEKAVREN